MNAFFRVLLMLVKLENAGKMLDMMEGIEIECRKNNIPINPLDGDLLPEIYIKLLREHFIAYPPKSEYPLLTAFEILNIPQELRRGFFLHIQQWLRYTMEAQLQLVEVFVPQKFEDLLSYPPPYFRKLHSDTDSLVSEIADGIHYFRVYDE